MKPSQETGAAYTGRMQLVSIFWHSFLDGFTFPGLFGKPERPGAPEYLFAQPEDGEGAVEEPL